MQGVVDSCKATFGSNAVSILSNSVGTEDDVGHVMADETERTMGIPVIRHKLKKPACLEEVIAI